MNKRHLVIGDYIKRGMTHFIKEESLMNMAIKLGFLKYPKGFDKYKAVYTHIPKSAGTSICTALFGQTVWHRKIDFYRIIDPVRFENYFKFTFVRNPWDRLVSAYFFLKEGGENSLDAKWAKKNLSQFTGFDDFVKNWVNEKNIMTYIHFIPQIEFISDEDGNIQTDFVGKIENLAEDFKILETHLGDLPEIPHLNRSKRNDYKQYYTDETIEIVRNAYKRDIEFFKYAF